MPVVLLGEGEVDQVGNVELAALGAIERSDHVVGVGRLERRERRGAREGLEGVERGVRRRAEAVVAVRVDGREQRRAPLDVGDLEARPGVDRPQQGRVGAAAGGVQRRRAGERAAAPCPGRPGPP